MGPFLVVDHTDSQGLQTQEEISRVKKCPMSVKVKKRLVVWSLSVSEGSKVCVKRCRAETNRSVKIKTLNSEMSGKKPQQDAESREQEAEHGFFTRV